MLRFFLVLFTLLISSASIAKTNEVTLPKSIIIELVDYHCSNPKPNPRISADLEYDCADPYEDADGEAQSMGYSLRLLPLIKDNFNQDGKQDIALEIESMGPLGGSVHTNSAVHYLLLDSDKRIIDKHQILLYAPFSEHIVEYELEGKRIYYSAIPNYRSNPEAYEDGELLEPVIEFEVNWQKGIPVSTYYKDNCKLANNLNNNQIFRPKRGVKRSKQIDIHEYTQVIEEEIAIDDLLIAADLNGCNERQVSFFIKPKAGKSLPVLADILQALIPMTYYDKPLLELLKLDKQSQLVFGEVIALAGSWSGQIHITREVNNSSIQINLSEEE